MTEIMGWLALLTGWITLLWIGGAIGEWIVPMLQRSRGHKEGKLHNRMTESK